MLKRLDIRDYLLVCNVSLEFSHGFTVLTGETGAGKSMILGAIEILLGDSFSKDAIRAGAESAIVEGVFDVSGDSEIIDLLGDDYLDDQSDELILRRELSNKGRARSYINDRPAPASLIGELRELLVDFHGQREHQSLFKPSRQLDYLDAYCGSLDLATRVAEIYKRRNDLARERDSIKARLDAHRKDQALLTYQLEEIERLGLKPGEEQEIETRLNKLENSEKLTLQSQKLLDLLSENESSLTVFIGRARGTASDIAKTDSELRVLADELHEIEARIKDISAQVRDYVENSGVDEDELNRLRERRTVLWDMKRKHGVGLDDIIARAGELKELLRTGDELEKDFARVLNDVKASETELISAAKALSDQRRKGAKALSDRVTSALPPLGFAYGRFEVKIESDAFDSAEKISRSGADKISFLFTANAGGTLNELANVASGGESSRLTLAIKTVLADRMNYPLMIYDEVDMGISGRIADAVGARLSKLGQSHQLIVITHLPQIASQADSHLLVEKKSSGNLTVTTARFLDEKERVTAVASLLAGAEVSGTALASADELLNRGKTNKKPSRTIG